MLQIKFEGHFLLTEGGRNGGIKCNGMPFIRFYKDTQKGHSEDQSGQGLTLIAAQNPVKREKLPLLLLSQLFLGEGLLEGLMLEGLVLVVPIQVVPQLVAGSSDRFVAC